MNKKEVLRIGKKNIVVDDLPSLTIKCHASNLHIMPDGSLACVWFGGKKGEYTGDTSIWFSRKSLIDPHNTNMWSKPVAL